MKQQEIYAFAKIDDLEARDLVYQEIKRGKSRFGKWNQIGSLRDKWYGKNAFLLRITKGDWIVHVNMPKYGHCVAVKVVGEYYFDEGLDCKYGNDFNNVIPVDSSTLIEFDRNDPNVLPSVNLAPRRRGQRVLQVEDFLASIRNLKNKEFSETQGADRSLIHLKDKINGLLPVITAEIQEMNKSKKFESFLHKIFSNMPNTISVKNGFGWGTDHGADLIVEFENPVIGINISTKLIVQAKSYTGKHFDTNAIDQIVEGIKRYDADAGLLITTAEETEELEEYVRAKSEEIQKTIDIIAGADVARFVIRYAPEFLIGSV